MALDRALVKAAACSRRAWILAFGLASAGCGQAIGPEVMPTTTLRGRIHLEGRPVVRGWIEIVPVDGTVGRLRSAPIAADGGFSAEKVPVGQIAFRLAGPPPIRTGERGLDRFLALARRVPVFRRETRPGDIPPVDVELRKEQAGFERIYGSTF